MIKNRTLSILPELTAVALAMAARGAFAGKVVVLPSLPEAALPNSEVMTSAKM